MTVSESNQDEWQVKLTQLITRDFRMAGSVDDLLAVMERPEIHAVFSFDKSSVTDGELYEAMRLFWGVYEQWGSGHTQRGPLLSPEYEDLFLDWFEHLQHSRCVPYIPDVDDGLDNHHELFFYLHIAAARALRIRKGNELSEEVLDCLIEVERTMVRLGATSKGPGFFFGEAPSFYTSAGAILSMVFVDLWRIRQAEGRYADALHYLSSAARYYDGAAQNFYGEYINELWPEIAEEEHSWESRLQRLLTGLDVSAEDAVQTFQTIRSDKGSDFDWAQVARDCRSIADSSARAWQSADNTEQDYGPIHLWGDEDAATLDRMLDELYELRDKRGIHLEITDEVWGPVTWNQFWHKAEAWTRTQLSPSEYRKMREDDEKHAAETRLKNYFFGNNWSHLPERAQRGLITADVLLNLIPRVRLEALLNELRIATEEMCYQVIWQPLKSTSRSPSFELLNEVAKLEEKQRFSDLGIADYEWICRQKWYREFLDMTKLDSRDVRFLTGQLPEDISQLRSERNVAEHEVDMSPVPDSPQSFYRGFLGIGREGVLPQLARIGRKLQSRRL